MLVWKGAFADMYNRYTRMQLRHRWSRSDLALTLLPFLPVIILFAILDIRAPLGSSWQKTVELAAYGVVTVIIPFMEVWQVYRRIVRVQIVFSLIFLSYYLTSLETFSHNTTWMLIVAPAVFICIACVLMRPPFEAFLRRLAIYGAVFLFLANMYLADLLHLWWMSLIISLAVGCGVWLFLRVFSMYPRYRRSIIGQFTVVATVSMVLISFFLGLTTTNSTIVGVGANFVACIIAVPSVRLLTPKRSILLWCALTLLILLGTGLFYIHDSVSLIVCVLAGLGIVGAVAVSWHLPILPFPIRYRPYAYNPVPVPPRPYAYNPEFDEDYFDEEDDSEDEDMPVLNDDEECVVQGDIEDEDDGHDS